MLSALVLVLKRFKSFLEGLNIEDLADDLRKDLDQKQLLKLLVRKNSKAT